MVLDNDLSRTPETGERPFDQPSYEPTGQPIRQGPASPDQGVGRSLRVLTGVDEDLLDWVWEERARYTGLGGIVLGTAIMATLSLLDALHQIFSVFWLLLLPIAAFWGCLIATIDRWLISSTHGLRSARWLIFAPRLALALIFGVIIAGPLVLTVFQSAIVQEVKDQRTAWLNSYASRLRTCNPIPGTPADPAARDSVDCSGLRIVADNPAIGKLSAQQRLQQQRDQLAKALNRDQKSLSAMDQVARDECNGIRKRGLSGIVGQGPNCERNRQRADQFRRDSRIAQRQAELDALDRQIETVHTDTGTLTQQYATARDRKITEMIAEERSHQGRIGLLERIYALGRLASGSIFVFSAMCVLGLFIVTVDCLPVLAKIMSGSTAYDRLVSARLASGERMSEAWRQATEREMTTYDEIRLHQIESDASAALEKIDEASRVGRARRDADLDERIAELAAQYRGKTT